MADLEWEIEEPEPVEASHLLRVSCAKRCGQRALCAPGRERTALCTACIGQSVAAPQLHGRYVPAVGYPQGVRPVVEEVREEHPAPEVGSREGTWPDRWVMPVPIRALDRLAEACGWQARVQYARGTALAKYHGQWQRKESVALRIARRGFGAYAVYVHTAGRPGGWTWGSVWLWGETLLPFGHAGVTELETWLEAGGTMPPGWYGEIRERRRTQAQASKMVACPGVGSCDWADRGTDHTHRANGDIKPRKRRAGVEHGG